MVEKLALISLVQVGNSVIERLALATLVQAAIVASESYAF